MSSDNGTGDSGLRSGGETPQVVAPVFQGSASGPETPAKEEMEKLSFTEIIRQLRMMQVDIENYKSVVYTGSLRLHRARVLDKASEIVERAQTEHRARQRT